MNLDDVKFHTIIDPLPPLGGGKQVPVIEGEVVEGGMAEASRCSKCEVEESQKLPNGTCDVCGANWVSTSDALGGDESDDFSISLELLGVCLDVIQQILLTKRLVNTMSVDLERKLRDTAMQVEDFTETYSEFEEASEQGGTTLEDYIDAGLQSAREEKWD